MADIVRAFTVPRLEYSSATNFIHTIRTLAEEMTDEDFKAFGDISAKFIESFNEATSPYSDTMKEAGGNLLTNLSSALRIGMGTNSLVGPFDAQPIIDAIILAISAGEDRIATEVHTMIQNGINGAATAGAEGEVFSVSDVFDLNSLFGGEGVDFTALLSGNSDLLLANVKSIFYGEGGSESNPMSDSLLGMMTQFSTQAENLQLPDFDETLGQISEKLTFKDENGNTIDLATYLQDNFDKMSESLKNAEETFTITIVPTLDWQNLTADSIRQQLGDMPVNFPMNVSVGNAPIKIDYTGLSTELGMGFIQDELVEIENAIDQERTEVVSAINSMSTHLDYVSATIRNLKLYLDTGALVGGITPYIDRQLARRAALAGRTGVNNP